MKKRLKRVLPANLYYLLKNIKIVMRLLLDYFYDLRKFFLFSSAWKNNTPTKLIGNIIRQYHILEKGLTMPMTRLGFASNTVVDLCRTCGKFIRIYGNNDVQLQHAISVLKEYKELHVLNDYQLDPIVFESIEELVSDNLSNASKQKEVLRTDYFSSASADFKSFSNSRSSVRNFTEEEVGIDRINDALNIARNTPSACNRQPWRTYIYSDKKKINSILELQGGSRGFGHLTNKLIIITTELGLFRGSNERNQAYIDGGMYAMNLLYSLHYNEIATCILNCSNATKRINY